MPDDPFVQLRDARISREQDRARRYGAAARAIAADPKRLAEFKSMSREQQSAALDSAVSSASPPPATLPGRPRGSAPILETMIDQSGVLGVDTARDATDAAGLGLVGDVMSGDEIGLDSAGDALMLGATTIPGGLALRSAGPVGRGLARSVAGSSAGAFAAGGVQQVLENAERLRESTVAADRVSRLDALDQAIAQTSSREVFNRAASEALLEAAGSGAFVAGPTAAKAAFGRFAGLELPAVDKWLEMASQHKVGLGVQDVTSSRLVGRLRDTLGRIPIMNRRFKSNFEAQAAEVNEAFDQTLFSVAPTMRELENVSLSERASRTLQRNLDAYKSMQKSFDQFYEGSNQLYSVARRESRREGTRVAPIEGLREAMIVLDDMGRRTERLVRETAEDGTRVITGTAPRRTSSTHNRVERFLKESFVDGEPAPELENYIHLSQEIEDLINDPQIRGTRYAKFLIRVKRAMELDVHGGEVLNDLGQVIEVAEPNLIGSERVKDLWKSADDFYSDGIDLFSGVAAQRFGRIDRTFGSVRKRGPERLDPLTGEPVLTVGTDQGPQSVNRTVSTLMNSEDAGVVDDVYRMMQRGDPTGYQESWDEMVGLRLDSIYQKSRIDVPQAEQEVVSAKKVREALGLNDTNSDKFTANHRMFELAGVSLDDFSDLLDLSEKIFKEGVPDISTFLARRTQLAGIKSAMRALTPQQFAAPRRQAGQGVDVAGALQDVVSGVSLFFMLGGAAKHVTDRHVLNGYKKLFNESLPLTQRTAALKRLLIMDSGLAGIDQFFDRVFSEAQNEAARFFVDTPLPQLNPDDQSVPFPDLSREEI